MESNNKPVIRATACLRKRAGALLTYTILTALLTSFLTTGKAQIWNEFFKQKKTQKKYLLQQIAALQMYIGYVQKGYEIADEGISTVKSIQDGEFSLHSAFFSSLKAVSPVIRNNTRVAEIIEMQLAVSGALKEIKKEDNLTPENIEYITDVSSTVLKECASGLDELLLVITAGKTEMKDDERLKRLDNIYHSMKNKSDFVQNFSGEVLLLTNQRRSEQESLKKLGRFYEND
ncbi:hypothetical protein BDE36_2438 [Arcticibacter tournemirensis]|uniref:TerB family tellurite resistance protein n=1 Tax=Arcticibacter tournemirensis TaxID=699437 RepID=A0A5M9H0I4_9SPHI|nr:hypothetical protein [Arcticibacter tournemirensis]KAA8480080.1 hypothetical protein F1649_15785 [Arcticibacter tournemirensis]TQM50683.1 hypothetical protein BDE36_2438 [Arcticibacter tournemirensis]